MEDIIRWFFDFLTFMFKMSLITIFGGLLVVGLKAVLYDSFTVKFILFFKKTGDDDVLISDTDINNLEVFINGEKINIEISNPLIYETWNGLKKDVNVFVIKKDNNTKKILFNKIFSRRAIIQLDIEL